MIVTTTNNVEGKKIVEYKGIVCGEVMMGANVVRDFLASITDVIGGRSGAYESKLKEGSEIAIREIQERAKRLGANAVVGVDIDYSEMREGMMMIVATGTAVVIE
jgi:uncharacterized protein YbjQ (UPF0145 family)